MISHNEKYQDLVKAKNKTDEENAIALLQITKCVQIRKNYKTANEESALKSLKSNLTNYFGKQPNEENGTIFTNLLFGSLEESLFSFVFLENCGIRTNFIKKWGNLHDILLTFSIFDKFIFAFLCCFSILCSLFEFIYDF